MLLRFRRTRRTAVFAIALCALIPSLSAPAQAGLDSSIERSLGRQAARSLEATYGVIDAGPLKPWLNQVGDSLAEVCPRHDVRYVFKILDTDDVNAAACPHGYIYVTKGMIEYVESSDELANVIAHEIGHVVGRHSIHAFKKQFFAELAFLLIDMPAAALAGGRLASNLYFLRHSRKDEFDADRKGATYAYEAGYDCTLVLDFFSRLGEHERPRSKIDSYFATHPPSATRRERLADLPQVGGADADSLLRIGDGLAARHLYGQAIARYRMAADLAPQRADAHLRMGAAWQAVGDYERARSAYQRAVELAPGDPAAQAALAALPREAAPAPDPPPVDTERLAHVRGELERLATAMRQLGFGHQAAEENGEGEEGEPAIPAEPAALASEDPTLAVIARRAWTARQTGDGVQADYKELVKRIGQTAQRLVDASAFNYSWDAQRAIQRAASILMDLDRAAGRLREAADSPQKSGDHCIELAEAMAGRLDDPTVHDRAGLLAAAERYLAAQPQRWEEVEKSTRIAADAIKRALEGARYLRDAAETLGFWMPGGYASIGRSQAAEFDLDRAAKATASAGESAVNAAAIEIPAGLDRATWDLTLRTYTIPPARQAQFDALAADYLSTTQPAFTAARQDRGSYGEAVLALALPPPEAERKPKPGTPPDLVPLESTRLLVALLTKDIDCELAAGETVPAEPEPSGHPAGAPEPPARP